MRPFLSFKRQEGVFRDFGLLNDVLGKIDPAIVPLKFQRGSFELIKKFERFFFHLEVLPEVSRKYEDFFSRPSKYEL